MKMTTSRKRRLLVLGFAVGFGLLSASIEFFHTDGSLTDRKSCPACHFLASSLSAGPAMVVVLPPLACLGEACVIDPLRFRAAETRDFLSRSPPVA